MGVFSKKELRELVWEGLEEPDLIALYVSSEEELEYSTSAFVRMIGFNPQERSPAEFSPLGFVHPEDREKTAEIIQQRYAGEKPPTDLAEFRIVRKDGSTGHVLGSAVWLKKMSEPAFVAALVDVTEQVKAFEQLRQALEGTIHAMARVVETRDPYTAGHQRRVAALACTIAERLEIPKEILAGIQMAGVVHDLGKLPVPTDILSNPGKLTDLEFGIIKTHPQVAYDILKDIDFTWPVANIAFQHHERFDGSGYPQGLAGEDILIEARILGVADVVEAMASHRPYRPALGIDPALEEISAGRGTRYAPEPAAAWLEVSADGSFTFEA